MADSANPASTAANAASTAPQDDNVEMVDVTGDAPAHDKEKAAEEGEGDEDDEDEEYEIEDILGHELKNGRYRYLVSWVGYGPEHNSWTLEKDFGSTEILDDYWNKKGGRPEPNSASKSRRKGAAATNSKRASSSQTPQNKKKGSAASPSRNGSKAPGADAEEPTLGDLAAQHQDSIAKYKQLPNWEDHVEKISTVERSTNNRLIVYMIMKDGSRTCQDSAVCNARCPQKMLEFYEAHLRWRHVKN